MLKDIDQPKMTDFAIAMVPLDPELPEGETDWECYLINLRSLPVRDVLVTSTGYRKEGEEDIRSSTLRYFYDQINAEDAVMLELVPKQLTNLTNEFWVSFTFEGHMYDKRYMFVEGSLDPAHLTRVPVLDLKGILIH